MDDKILVFIPVYNCAPQIPRVLALFTDPTIARYFSEILVLDNGSKDETMKAARKAAAKIKTVPITLARNRENYGLGGSHKSAFGYGVRKGFTHIVVLHGDDQGDIHDLLPILDRGAHREYACCLGSRFMPGSRLKGYSRFRIFGNYVFNAIFSIAARKKVRDLGAGLNIFATDFIRHDFYKTYADNLTFNCYLLLGITALKMPFKFFPITWREDDQISNVKLFSQAFQTLSIALRYLRSGEEYLSSEHRDMPHREYLFDSIVSPQSLPSVSLIMPMAGRGSRFVEKGFHCPKPLIDLGGRPFFWWATESIRREFNVRDLVYVVLDEHIRKYQIDQKILHFYPEAKIIALPESTNGALETAMRGIESLTSHWPVIINDCDHAFDGSKLAKAANVSETEMPAGLLCHFSSSTPIYSFAEYDRSGCLIRTVEKQAISNSAIAGAYWFRNKEILKHYAEIYTEKCPYNELFVSGIYNEMVAGREKICGAMVEPHVPFGIVSEYEAAIKNVEIFSEWLQDYADFHAKDDSNATGR